jgi:hypothetical protein
MSALKRAVDDVMQHQWSNSREAMAALKRLLDAADEAEEVVEVLAQNRRTDGRREWAGVGAWLQPGQAIAKLSADDARLVRAAPAAVATEKPTEAQMLGGDLYGGGRF